MRGKDTALPRQHVVDNSPAVLLQVQCGSHHLLLQARILWADRGSVQMRGWCLHSWYTARKQATLTNERYLTITSGRLPFQQGFKRAMHGCRTHLRVRPTMPARLLPDEPIYLLEAVRVRLSSCGFSCRALRQDLQWAEEKLQHVVKAAILAVRRASEVRERG